MKGKDYIENIQGAERRFFTETVEVRKEGDDEFFEGYAVRFGDTADLGWFTEEIDRNAFSDVMGDDVRALFNHDPDVVLGRSSSKTLSLSVDSKGVKYSARYNPNDPDHVRVMEKVKRGDVSQSSFAVIVSDDEWSKRDGKEHRVVKKLKRWFDVAPVTYPAYQDTTVAARSLDLAKKESLNLLKQRKQLFERKYKLKNG